MFFPNSSLEFSAAHISLLEAAKMPLKRKVAAIASFVSLSAAAGRIGNPLRTSSASAVLHLPRGGSTGKSAPTDKRATESESEWLLKQLTLRQQRLKELSGGLEEAGFQLPALSARRGSGPIPKVTKGWDCTVAPEDDSDDEDDEARANEVLPCLIMGEVMPGLKAVSPSGTGKWVTLWELNKMRRQEPQKVEGLWYDQFDVDCQAFSRAGGPPGAILALFLDKPPVLHATVGLTLVATCVVLKAPLGFGLVKLLTAQWLWKAYLSWSRIVYAPLPMKLYFATVLWKDVLAKYFTQLEKLIRERLVEAECELVEFSMPCNALPKSTVEELGQ